MTIHCTTPAGTLLRMRLGKHIQSGTYGHSGQRKISKWPLVNVLCLSNTCVLEERATGPTSHSGPYSQ